MNNTKASKNSSQWRKEKLVAWLYYLLKTHEESELQLKLPHVMNLEQGKKKYRERERPLNCSRIHMYNGWWTSFQLPNPMEAESINLSM
jgi:hypothetical protein